MSSCVVVIIIVLLAGSLDAQPTSSRVPSEGVTSYQIQRILNKLEGLESQLQCQADSPDTGPSTDGDPDSCNPDQEVRLVGAGPQENSGRLEVWVRGTWSAVCSTRFSFAEAIVTCKQLGYGHGIVVEPTVYGTGNKDILVDSVTCSGNEKSILDCTHRLLEDSCTTAVGLECVPGPCGSRLEFLETVKRDVATRGVQYLCQIPRQDSSLLTTPCRDLIRDLVVGYHDHTALLDAGGDFGCLLSRGPEDDSNRLDACGNGKQSESLDTCDDCQRMFVCIDYPGTKDIRLVDGPDARLGRLEVLWDGIWVGVSDISFGNEETIVACRQLGYGWGYKVNRRTFPAGTGPVWLYGIHCTGQEDRLDSCWSPADGYGEYTYPYEANLKCVDAPCGSDMYYLNGLMSGPAAENGFDRMCYINRTRPDLVNVRCSDLLRSLLGGFLDSAALKAAGGSFGCHLGSLQDSTGLQACVADRQSEARLSDCDHCTRLYVCINYPRPTGARLVNGTVPNAGRVEIQINGQWGTVCNRYGGTIAAAVICRSLGYDYGSYTQSYGVGNLPVVLISPRCIGIEDRVEYCPPYSITTCDTKYIIAAACYYYVF